MAEGTPRQPPRGAQDQLPPQDAETEVQEELQRGQAGEYLLAGGQPAPQAAGQVYQNPRQMQQHPQRAAPVHFHPEQQGYGAQAALFPHQGFAMPPQPAGQVYHNVPPASQAAANIGQPPALQMSVGAFGGATVRIESPAAAGGLVAGGLVAGAFATAAFAASKVSESPAVVLGTGLAAGVATGVTTLAGFYLGKKQGTEEAIRRVVERERHIRVENIEEGSLLVHVKFLTLAGYWVLRSFNEKIDKRSDRTCLQLLLEDELRGIGWTGPIQSVPPSVTTEDSGLPEDVSSVAAMSITSAGEVEEGPLKRQRAKLQKHKDSPTAQRCIKAYRSWEEGAELQQWVHRPGGSQGLDGTSTVLYGQSWLNLNKAQLKQLMTSQLQADPTDSTCLLLKALHLPHGDSRVQTLRQVVDAILQHGPGDWLYQHLHHIYCYLGIAIWRASPRPKSTPSQGTDQPRVDLNALAKALSAMASSLMYKQDYLETVFYTAELSKKVSETEAIRQFEHFLRLAPECDRFVPDAHYRLATLYNQQQDRQKAIHHFTRGQQTEANRLPVFGEVHRSIKDPAKMAYERLQKLQARGCDAVAAVYNHNTKDVYVDGTPEGSRMMPNLAWDFGVCFGGPGSADKPKDGTDGTKALKEEVMALLTEKWLALVASGGVVVRAFDYEAGRPGFDSELYLGHGSGKSTRIPYAALKRGEVSVEGLPEDFNLKKPGELGREKLQVILDRREEISVKPQSAEGLSSTAEELLTGVMTGLGEASQTGGEEVILSSQAPDADRNDTADEADVPAVCWPVGRQEEPRKSTAGGMLEVQQSVAEKLAGPSRVGKRPKGIARLGPRGGTGRWRAAGCLATASWVTAWAGPGLVELRDGRRILLVRRHVLNEGDREGSDRGGESMTLSYVFVRTAEGSLVLVQSVMHHCDPDRRSHVNGNPAHWLPRTGRGLIYGINREHLQICRLGYEPGSPQEQPAEPRLRCDVVRSGRTPQERQYPNLFCRFALYVPEYLQHAFGQTWTVCTSLSKIIEIMMIQGEAILGFPGIVITISSEAFEKASFTPRGRRCRARSRLPGGSSQRSVTRRARTRLFQEFLYLTKEQLDKLVSSDDLEESVDKAVIGQLHFKMENVESNNAVRKACQGIMMEARRYQLMKRANIHQQVNDGGRSSFAEKEAETAIAHGYWSRPAVLEGADSTRWRTRCAK
ncbi:hypothetical protein Bbelb_109880 [Branchiostoma belcheri]|nr:hypothetical protein Bbelb_109880 [Branchiostoma belcheri]